MTVFSDPGELSNWPEADRKDRFWLRRDTLAYLCGETSTVTTEAVMCEEVHGGRRILLTAQTFTFQASRQLSIPAGTKTSRWNFRKRVLGRFPSKTLVLGQLLSSGDYACDGLAVVPAAELAALLGAVAECLGDHRGGYRATVIKDLAQTGQILDTELRHRDYHPVPTEPVMILPIGHYTSLGDYLGQLTSKYRVRYRRARGKLAGVSRRPLSAPEVKERLVDLYDLYLETSSGADFNLTPLVPRYFLWLAETADIIAYFTQDEELVGFTTGIVNGPVYQAHFLGLREQFKVTHHLYHNMLFDLLEAGIASGSTSIDFGRTATEIKSSLGAMPRQYATLLKLSSPWLNWLVPRFASAIFEPSIYQLRNPFGR